MSVRRPTIAATRPLRALIVEDRENDLLLLLDELERGGYIVSYTRVETKAALKEVLADEGWDIVISDFSLPTMTAHDVLAIVTRDRPDLPCIVISGTISEESAVDVLRSGARDFVVKERLARLLPAIERELRESAERRRLHASESALRQTRERMQFALEAVGVGTWEAHLESGRTLWSEVLERLHGLEPGSFGGTFEAFIAAIHPDDRQDVQQRIERAQREGTDSTLEYRTIWPDGSEHWIAGIGRTICDERGAPVRAVGVGMDITSRRQLEEQVRQTQKMESIGNLAGGIAHDFNNLLTVILGESEFMAPSVKSDRDLAASLESIQTAAKSAAALTRQLLMFSRRQVVKPAVLNLDETINGFVKILRRLVEESVDLQFQFSASRAVRIDPGQIEQVLLNLVANARDAMPDGGTVTIATRDRTVGAGDDPADVPQGSYVVLSVMDTGSGLPPEVRQHLFEPFFTTKPVGRGTGLGLATVHSIVKQSGGQIQVHSEVGAGTTFTIYLPVATTAAEGPAEVRGAAPPLHGTETILVVEDSAPLRQLTARILGKYGYRVLAAANATQARQHAEQSGEIDLVLTDVVMPGDSGLTVGEWFREQRPQTKVVYMSGYTGDHRIADRGHGFLQKPFTARQLLELIREALRAEGEIPAG